MTDRAEHERLTYNPDFCVCGEQAEGHLTDRAEPGVTPLTADRCVVTGCAKPSWSGWSTCERHTRSATPTLATATPRPGLVEALRAEVAASVEVWQAVQAVDRYVAALASGTGEPGLDRAAVKAVIEDNMERAYRNGHQQGYGCGVEGATECDHVGRIDLFLANDKGADPTPEPK